MLDGYGKVLAKASKVKRAWEVYFQQKEEGEVSKEILISTFCFVPFPMEASPLPISCYMQMLEIIFWMMDMDEW